MLEISIEWERGPQTPLVLAVMLRRLAFAIPAPMAPLNECRHVRVVLSFCLSPDFIPDHSSPLSLGKPQSLGYHFITPDKFLPILLSVSEQYWGDVQCGDEIGRLEACQASVMRTMMAAKEKELTALCASTCLPTPDLTLLLSDIDTGSPGHVRSLFLRPCAF